jgi:hypothetical protein
LTGTCPVVEKQAVSFAAICKQVSLGNYEESKVCNLLSCNCFTNSVCEAVKLETCLAQCVLFPEHVSCALTFLLCWKSARTTGEMMGWLPQDVAKLIARRTYDEMIDQHKKHLETSIVIEWKKLVDLTEFRSMRLFVQAYRALSTFGVTCSLGANHLSLGVSWDAIWEIQARTCVVLRKWPLRSLRKWAVVRGPPGNVILDFGEVQENLDG